MFLTGAEGAFTAGVDLKQLNLLPKDERPEALNTANELMLRIVTMRKLVIAAVNGPSSGLGNHIVMCSDYCLMRRDAGLHFTGVSKGMPSMQFGTLLLPSIIGLKRAKALLMRGGRVSAERAEEIGICNEVIDPVPDKRVPVFPRHPNVAQYHVG